MMSGSADKHVKSGFLNVPPSSWLQTVLNKPWARKQCVLYGASRQGVPRLEVFDLLPSLRRKDPPALIIPLTDCLKVDEQRHKQHPFVFSVWTRHSSHVFETASVQEQREWVDALQRIAFGDGGETRRRLSAPLTHHTDTTVDLNQLYENVQRRSVFAVTVEETEAATALGLRGALCLEVSQSALLVRGQDLSLRYTWLFKHIRRYGQTAGTFVVEAGRSSETGAGTFMFRSPSACQLHSLLQTTMAQVELQHRNSAASAAASQPPPPPSAVPVLQTCTLGRKTGKGAPKMVKPPRRSKANESMAGESARASPSTSVAPLPNVVPVSDKQRLFTRSCDHSLYVNADQVDGGAGELVYSEPEQRHAAWRELGRNSMDFVQHQPNPTDMQHQLSQSVTSSGGARSSASYACLQHMPSRPSETSAPTQYARLTPVTPGGDLTSSFPAAHTHDPDLGAPLADNAAEENTYENISGGASSASSGPALYENVVPSKPSDTEATTGDNWVRHVAVNSMEYALIDKPLLRHMRSAAL